MPDQTITVTVYDTDAYDCHMPDEKLTDVIAWFQERLEYVPQEYRDIATVDFHADEYTVSIYINYERSETAEEVAERENRDRVNADRVRQTELDTLRRLKAKYEGAS